MSSFTHDQVAHFRELFNAYTGSEATGISRENFIPAIEASLESYHFTGPRPSGEHLDGEFQRITESSGTVQWPQFFQVLIHINLRLSASPPPEPPPEYAPPPVPPHTSMSTERVRGVQFDTGVVVTEEPPPPSYDQLAEEDYQRGNTMGHQFLRSVGNFFGVTDESQHGGQGRIGWAEFNERTMEDNNAGFFSTLSRRTSLRNRGSLSREPPPGYPAVATGRSFDLNEIGDDSDDETSGFTSAAPPNYGDVYEGSGFGGIAGAPVPQHYPEPTHPRPQAPPTSTEGLDLITNTTEAWQYYLKYVKAEKRLRQRRHQTDAYEFFGSADVPSSGSNAQLTRNGSVRRERLNSADPTSGVVRRPKKQKITKLQRQSTLIRTEVESLPSFWPVFIILVSLAQVLTMIVLLPIFGLAPIRAVPIERREVFPSLLAVNTSEEVTYFRSINLWIGPSPLDLIRLGAKFTPCMRRDFGIQRRNAFIYTDNEDTIGCCQNEQWVGTTFVKLCVSPTLLPITNVTSFEPTIRCSSNSSQTNPPGPNFHPCCVSITGQCLVVHIRECTARGGFFHEEADSCDAVNCFRDICGFNELLVGELNDASGEPNPLSPNAQQFWRFFTSIFIHLGVIHVVIIIPIQLYVGIKIERTIGWLRIGIIYILSGVGGNLLSGIFVPYGVNAGASGALFGLLGVLYVELFQFWQIVDRAWLELIKLTAFVVFLLALGTLPYVDNMSHIGGLLFGVPSAIIFVPYITFGRWDAARKRLLLIICLPLVFLMFVFGFITFYLIPDPSFCFFCHYINCVPYTSQLCPAEFSDASATVFSL